MSKPHFDNTLFQLTDEQQAQIYDWLLSIGYTETIKKIAEPPPEGFGLKTYRSALHRFFRRYSHQTLRHTDLADARERSSPDENLSPSEWLKLKS